MIGFLTGFMMGSLTLPGMVIGLYFTSINLYKYDIRSLCAITFLFGDLIRLFCIYFIFTNN